MAKRMYRMKRILVMLLTVVMLFCMVQSAFAAEEMDLDRLLTMSVRLASDDKVPGMEFRAYKLASMDKNAAMTVESEYNSYGVDFSNISDQDQWRTIAQTMQGYILRDGIAPTYNAVTDEEGVANFGEVERGVYLILADSYVYNYTRYTADAFLVAVPNLDASGAEWVYNVDVTAKYNTASEPPEIPETPGLEVIKLWRNEDSVTRPESVTAQLICEGQVVEEAVLNKENGWKYVWTKVETGKTYSVTEKEVPSGYTVAITYENQIFTMINTGETPPPTTPPTTPPSTPPTLPNTGVPWVPVIAVGGAGLVLFVAGLIRRNYE